MPHCRAAPGNLAVQVDYGITLTETSSINIDVTLPIAAAALVAKTIEQIDSAPAPHFAELPAQGTTI